MKRVPIVISMTTVPARNGTLGPTIASLKKQTLKPTMIRLYVTPACARPAGVECVETVDRGPVTKLSAIVDPKVPDDALVVTADDDVVYHPRWLETLARAAYKHPGEAIGMAGWNVAGFLADPAAGMYQFVKAPAVCDVLEGWAGVAYRRDFFGTNILDVPAPYSRVDDVWISANLNRRGIVRRLVSRPMCAANSKQPGLHHAADFVDTNRRAAVALFRTQPVQPNAPLLTICIPSLTARAPLLAELMGQLSAQPRFREVEILTDIDDGGVTTGEKRNRLVSKARGRYVVHVDDDDLVAPNYLTAVLGAIETNPDVDAILVRGRRTVMGKNGGGVLEFDYRLDGRDNVQENGAIWRSPGHLCPIRTELARRALFPHATIGEDVAWVKRIRPHLRTAARAGLSREVLYFYRWNPTKKPTPSTAVKPPPPPAPPKPIVKTKKYTPRSPLPKKSPPRPAARKPVMTDRIDDHARIFTPQYTKASGPGSTPKATVRYRAFLEQFILEHEVKTILDLGCGDLQVMSLVNLHGASYLGVDVIAARIHENARKHPEMRFDCADIRTFPIPAVDLVIVKDVLQHWATDEVLAWLAMLLSSKARAALITNCNYGDTVNTDIATGGWRALDLTVPPFQVGTKVFTWQCERGPFVDTKDTVLVEPMFAR